jgi:glycosyltransferase involved in cell wall biosynthesis
MRVLFLTNSDRPHDGYSVVGSHLAARLRNRHGIDLVLGTTDHKRSLMPGLNALKSTYVEKYGLLPLLYDVAALWASGRSSAFDLIHCNVEHFAPVARWLSNYWQCPYTVTAHGTYGVALPATSPRHRLAFEAADRVIGVSQFTVDRMKSLGVNARYAVIHSGVDKSRFKPSHPLVKQNYLTFVGNTKRRKGWSVLLDALEHMTPGAPTFTVKAVGNFTDMSSVMHAQLQRCAAQVEFMSDIDEDNLIRLYQQAKLNVLPSISEPMYFEGFGLIHSESIACGTLSVGSRSSGNVEAIYPGNGYLIEQGDSQALARIIADVMSSSDPALLAPAHPEQVADWAAVSDQYAHVFQDVVNRHSQTVMNSQA